MSWWRELGELRPRPGERSHVQLPRRVFDDVSGEVNPQARLHIAPVEKRGFEAVVARLLCAPASLLALRLDVDACKSDEGV